MPKAPNVPWTKEILERIANRSAPIAELATELGVAKATLYGMRARIEKQGIDEIVRRVERSGHDPRPPRAPETLAEQLAGIYRITASRGGHGDVTQYTLTIPSRLGEQWIARWGRLVHFVPTDEGLRVEPVVVDQPTTVPAWLQDGNREETS